MSNNLYLIDKEKIKNIANAAKNKMPDVSSEEEFTIPQLAAKISQLSVYESLVHTPKQKVYLFNNQAQDPYCTNITGGWDISYQHGCNDLYSTITVEDDNSIKFAASYYRYSTMSTNNKINWKNYIDKGYSCLVTIWDLPEGSTASLKRSNTKARKLFVAQSSMVNSTRSRYPATAFGADFQQKYQTCIGDLQDTGGSDAKEYIDYVIMPKIWTTDISQLANKSALFPESFLALGLGGWEQGTGSTSTVYYNTLAAYLILKQAYLI